ncbi:MAG: hypothetical protein GY933_23705 [Hyphomicrobiales bacterium]|nr:hypothetical protein [Hyphomicrobiales bacterium]
MKPNKRVVFAGLARDCAHALPAILRAIEELGATVDDWGYVFLENNSVDRTAKQLLAFDRKHHRGTVRTFGDLQSEIPKRTERLAMLRNRCIEEVFSDERLAGFEYLIVLDLDGVNEKIDKKRLLELMDLDEPQWTAIFANQSALYYDTWALRHPTWSPDDCWKQVRLRPKTMSHEESVDEFVTKRLVKLDVGRGFVRVQSAFGGIGLYRLQALHGCTYVGVDDEGHEICEHVSFNEALDANGEQLFIDPALINGSGDRRHYKGMGLITQWKRSINKRIARHKQRAD